MRAGCPITPRKRATSEEPRRPSEEKTSVLPEPANSLPEESEGSETGNPLANLKDSGLRDETTDTMTEVVTGADQSPRSGSESSGQDISAVSPNKTESIESTDTEEDVFDLPRWTIRREDLKRSSEKLDRSLQEHLDRTGE